MTLWAFADEIVVWRSVVRRLRRRCCKPLIAGGHCFITVFSRVSRQTPATTGKRATKYRSTHSALCVAISGCVFAGDNPLWAWLLPLRVGRHTPHTPAAYWLPAGSITTFPHGKHKATTQPRRKTRSARLPAVLKPDYCDNAGDNWRSFVILRGAFQYLELFVHRMP